MTKTFHDEEVHVELSRRNLIVVMVNDENAMWFTLEQAREFQAEFNQRVVELDRQMKS